MFSITDARRVVVQEEISRTPGRVGFHRSGRSAGRHETLIRAKHLLQSRKSTMAFRISGIERISAAGSVTGITRARSVSDRTGNRRMGSRGTSGSDQRSHSHRGDRLLRLSESPTQTRKSRSRLLHVKLRTALGILRSGVLSAVLIAVRAIVLTDRRSRPFLRNNRTA